MSGKLPIGRGKHSAVAVIAVDGGTPMATGPPGEA
jgi:hypothetical protein